MKSTQRCNQKSPKSTVRKTGLTYLTVAGVVSGTIGSASPAHAAVYAPMNCTNLASDLTSLTATGGTLTANFTGSCDFAEGFLFSAETTITGPTTGSLTLRFTDSSSSGFEARDDFLVSNLSFTRESPDTYFTHFIHSYDPINQPPLLTVSNSKFSNAALSAAIYAEGNLTVSDSSFENLTSYNGGAAILVGYTSTTTVSNSTFKKNKAAGQASGGAIRAVGTLTVANSTFDSNEAGDQGGAILAIRPDISNSTFVGNSAVTGAAVSLSEGALISNSTFWNNGDVDTASIATSPDSYFFGNILANSNSNIVKLFDLSATVFDLGANLYTDSTFDDTTTGAGSSKLVTLGDLKLSALALNSTAPTNTGSTQTVAIGSGSVARDYYAATSVGINPTALEVPSGHAAFATQLATVDQRGVARPLKLRFDVGALEVGEVRALIVKKQSISFAPGSSKLSTSSKLKLRKLAVEIQAKGLKRINLEGFTATYTKASASGKALRVSLSKSRASAVEKYLKSVFKKNGYAVTFTKSPKGAANPVKSNKTEKGRKDNRRVEIVIN